jgi:1-acyl-sn-glycerol-3-phosphate acyltransferase
MLDAFRAVRSLFSVLLVGVLFLLGSLVLRLWILPTLWLRPRDRVRLGSLFMKGMSGGILGLLQLGGARVRRRGSIPTGSPVAIVANHQSLLDITQIALLARPRSPAFVARKRYARFVPHVSATMRLLGCPIVDPRRDPAGAVEAVRQAARELPHGLVIFPEGHRSVDGRVRPFRTAGLEAMLAERRLPLYVVVNEGTWRVRRLADLLFRVHLVDAYAEVLGPWEPPADPEKLRELAQELRRVIVDRLADLRAGAAPPAERPR